MLKDSESQNFKERKSKGNEVGEVLRFQKVIERGGEGLGSRNRVLRVSIGASLYELRGNLHVPVLGCHHQRCLPKLRARLSGMRGQRAIKSLLRLEF